MRLDVHVVALLMAHRAPFALHPADDGHPAVVTLAGTHGWRDVLDDVDVRTCPWRTEGKVHCGMFTRTMRMWDDVEGFCRDESSVVLAGYSLGGGVSVLLAAMLETRGVHVHSVHTFGAPRVGDAGFAAWYRRKGLHARTLRYTTPKDPVPSLPPHWPTVGRRVAVPCAKSGRLAHHDLRAYLRGVHARRHVKLHVTPPLLPP